MSIVLEQLTKLYAGHPVVSELSLEIAEGELFVLLGASGSGKSTVLRIIAGLAEADGGRVVLHGRDVTALSPQARDIGFVFQSYALFRHLTVMENIAFALSVRRTPRAEKRRRCDELLELVGLSGLGRRLPSQLSGGQQQRVALARALAHRPKVLLLDEPFGALDARIRVELRRSLHAIQRELQVTTIFVTHDQEEAFELGDRIGVMTQGRLTEVGPPHELYTRPRTEIVATFLGGTNLFVGESTFSGVRIGPVEMPLPGVGEPGRRVQVLFRPEDVALSLPSEADASPTLGVGTVESVSFAGPVEHLRLRLPPFVGVRAIAPPAPFGADYFLVHASRPSHEARRLPLGPGGSARVAVRRVHLLTHPGLHFLLATDGSAWSRAALAVGGELAAQAHARVTLLACGPGNVERTLASARETLGPSAAEAAGRTYPGPLAKGVEHGASLSPCDLVIAGVPPAERASVGEQILAAGEHHLLFASTLETLPSRVLLCTAAGEPGKRGVAFTGRLVRHLRAQVTVMTVLPASASSGDRVYADRFLQKSVTMLQPLGIAAGSLLSQGNVDEEIPRQLRDGDLLVLGAPYPRDGRRMSLSGVVGPLLLGCHGHPVLIVRGHSGRG